MALTNPIMDWLGNGPPGGLEALLKAHSATSLTPPAPAQPPPVDAGLQAPSKIQKPAQIGAPPPAATATMSSPPPAMGAPTMPNVPPPRGTEAGDINERARMESTGPGISQIHSKIENSQFGQNHPTLGKIAGYGAEIPLRVLEAAGSMFAPIRTAEMLLPGTQAHHAMEMRNLNSNIGKESQENLQGAQAGEATARAGEQAAQTSYLPQKEADTHALQTAQTGEANARAKSLENPTPKTEFELWHNQNPTGTPEQFEQLQKKPLTATDAASRNAVWNSIAPKYHLPTDQFHEGMSEAEAGQLATAMNAVVGRDQGGTKITIEQQRANQTGDRTRDAQTEKEYMAASKDLGTAFSGLQTQKEALEQAGQELSGGAVGQAVGTIKTLVGLAGGKGSGVRITTAELNALIHARGIEGDFNGWLNGLEGKGKLDPGQLAQMQQVLSDVARKVAEKQGKYGDTLDKLGKANSTEEIRQIQSDFRHQLTGGGNESGSSGKGVSLKDAMAMPSNKGKSEADVRKDIEAHGHTVTP